MMGSYNHEDASNHAPFISIHSSHLFNIHIYVMLMLFVGYIGPSRSSYDEAPRVTSRIQPQGIKMTLALRRVSDVMTIV